MTTIISFNWWHDGKEEISERHQNELRDHAIERIAKMTKESYITGELYTGIEDIQYQGSWEYK